MLLIDKALFAIERNLNRDLTLREIAKNCDVSRYHLAHAFGEATGYSVMEYLRGRRLTEAAYALAAGASGILDVALDTGYSSHEAFSRAFKAQFCKTPEEVRKAESVSGLEVVNAIRAVERKTVQIEPPAFQRSGQMVFVGLAERFGFGATENIPGQWQRFMRHYEEIDHKAKNIPVGIMAGADDDGNFNYICAVEVSRAADVPKPLTTLTLAPATYAVFQHRGHVTQLRETYDAIWNDWFPASGRHPADAPSLEHHNPTFDPRTGEGGLTLWIPVQD